MKVNHAFANENVFLPKETKSKTLNPRKYSKFVKRWLPRNVKNQVIGDPFQEFNHEYKCIFIHIPKCAGISVGKSLFGVMAGHSKVWHYEFYDEQLFHKYFKFTFVRNPWDRLVSAFHFLKKGGRNSLDRKWAKDHLQEIASFNEFVQRIGDDTVFQSEVLNQQHFRPQVHYLKDAEGAISLDFIGKFESLEEDFMKIAEELDVQTTLKEINKGAHKHYSEYYNGDSQDIVSLIYREDIEFLNYDFH